MLRFDVLVIGAGPAGLAAASAAAEAGARVGIVDAHAQPGGQIWRGPGSKAADRAATRWLEALKRPEIRYLPGTQVVDQPETGYLRTESDDGAETLAYGRLILATGARELFLPFPGWTLPNVVGAGGLQALVKLGLPIEGRRVVVAGSGPLLRAAAAHLVACGALVTIIAEQASRRALIGFGWALRRYPGKWLQGMRLQTKLRGVPRRTDCWPVRADGDGRVESVTLTDGRRTWVEACQYLACGFGLVPNLELPLLLGSHASETGVCVDLQQETSCPGVYAAGEVTGVGGVDLALEEGRIAGYMAANRPDVARSHFARRARWRTFEHALARSFALRPELSALSDERTVVCRCEDVTYATLRRFPSWREAKLQSRCGMGSCQGRVCGAATRVLFGWGPEGVRPPLFPARLGTLAATGIGKGKEMDDEVQAAGRGEELS